MRGRFPFLGAPALSVYPVLADSPSSPSVRLVMQTRRLHLARLSLTRGEGRKKQHIGRKFESFVTVFSPVVVGSVDSRSLTITNRPKRQNKLINTEVPELQDVPQPNRQHPPLQPKRLCQIGSFFSWEPLRWILSGSSRGFLNFASEAELLGINMLISERAKCTKMTQFQLSISASRTKFKNRLDDPESNVQRGFHRKFELIRPRGLGCRGGCYRFWLRHTL